MQSQEKLQACLYNQFLVELRKHSPSNGLTVNAAVEPATQPARNDVQKTASPLPSFLRGPRAFKCANNGKQTIEKLTSRNIVAAVPLQSPAIPRVRKRSRAIDVAD